MVKVDLFYIFPLSKRYICQRNPGGKVGKDSNRMLRLCPTSQGLSTLAEHQNHVESFVKVRLQPTYNDVTQ